MQGIKEKHMQNRLVSRSDGQGAGGSSSRDITRVLVQHIVDTHVRSFWLTDDEPVDKDFIERMSVNYDTLVNWLKSQDQ